MCGISCYQHDVFDMNDHLGDDTRLCRRLTVQIGFPLACVVAGGIWFGGCVTVFLFWSGHIFFASASASAGAAPAVVDKVWDGHIISSTPFKEDLAMTAWGGPEPPSIVPYAHIYNSLTWTIAGKSDLEHSQLTKKMKDCKQPGRSHRILCR